MVRTGISRGLAVAALIGMGALAGGSLTPAHAAGSNLHGAVVPMIKCPSSSKSNSSIVKSGSSAKYSPANITGKVATTAVASICVKNTTSTTQTMTAPSCANFNIAPGATLALSASAPGTYKCGLKGSSSVLTAVIS